MDTQELTLVHATCAYMDLQHEIISSIGEPDDFGTHVCFAEGREKK